MSKFIRLACMGMLIALLFTGALRVAAAPGWEIYPAADRYVIQKNDREDGDPDDIIMVAVDDPDDWYKLEEDHDIIRREGDLTLTVNVDATVDSVNTGSGSLTIEGTKTLTADNSPYSAGVNVRGGDLIVRGKLRSNNHSTNKGILVDSGDVIIENGGELTTNHNASYGIGLGRGNLIIRNGTLTANSNGTNGVFMQDNGSGGGDIEIFENGHLSVSDNGYPGIYGAPGTELTINGGTATADGNWSNGVCLDGGDIIMNGGTFRANDNTYANVYVEGSIRVDSGTFSGMGDSESGIKATGEVFAGNGASITGKGAVYGIYANRIGGYGVEGNPSAIKGIAKALGKGGAETASIFAVEGIWSEGYIQFLEEYTDAVRIDDQAPVNPYADGANIASITNYAWSPYLSVSSQGLLATGGYSGAIKGSRTREVAGELVGLTDDGSEHRVTFANAVLIATPRPAPKIPITGIKINEPGKELETDEVFPYTATVSPSNYTTTNPVTWESDKPGVASVNDKGVVTAKSPGTATITAKIMDGDFDNRAFSDSVKVTVPELEVFDIGIEVLAMKACKPLELPILAGYKGTWTIGNASIARVGPKQKLVKALTRGETTLTFTVENVISKKALVLHDRVLKPGDTYVIRFNVRKAGELPKSISLDRKKLTLDTVSNTTAQLTATVKPLKALDREVFFLSKNPSVATVDRDGNVTAVAPGTAKILAVSANLKRAVVTVTVESAVAVKPVKKALKVGGTVALEAVVQEALPDKALVWTSNKPDVASVDENGVVTGLKKGKVGIVATATNGDTARCVVTVRKK